MRMRCRFGSKRRFVATIEWLRLWPKLGLRPHSEQTLDIGDSCFGPRSGALDGGERSYYPGGRRGGQIAAVPRSPMTSQPAPQDVSEAPARPGGSVTLADDAIAQVVG